MGSHFIFMDGGYSPLRVGDSGDWVGAPGVLVGASGCRVGASGGLNL